VYYSPICLIYYSEFSGVAVPLFLASPGVVDDSLVFNNFGSNNCMIISAM